MMGKLSLVVAALLGIPCLAVGQDRIGPAETIRVFEKIDLASRSATRHVVEDLSPAEILRLQIELDRVGYDPHSRSGVLDERTRHALSRFQADRGLEVCGCVTYEAVVALGIVPRVVARIESAAATTWGYDRRYDRGYDRNVPVVIVVPSRRHDHFFAGPGVVVGHEPAIGAGQFHRRFPSRPERVGAIRPAPPGPPPRPGSRIRPGDWNGTSSGTGARSSRPRP